MKLIDDLLSGDDDSSDKVSAAKDKKNASPEATRVVSPRGTSPSQNKDDDEGFLELSQSIYAEGSNPFGLEDTSEPPHEKTVALKKPAAHKQAEDESDDTVRIDEASVAKRSAPPSAPSSANDKTKVIAEERAKIPENSVVSQLTSSHIKASVGRYVGSGGVSSPTQASLVQSENLRVAQQKILELEEEISRLRTANEELAAAGETLKRVADEAKADHESLERKLEAVKELAQQEQQILKDAIEVKDRKIATQQSRIEEMELRLSTNIQKIRVRERELENRLELVRMEGQALARSKDEMVLDLKRQIDQLNIELENYRSKGQELNSQLKDKQELLRRTVKALRLALSMLEGDEEANLSLKKAK